MDDPSPAKRQRTDSEGAIDLSISPQAKQADSSGYVSASASSEEEQEDQQRTPDDWYPQFLQKVARDQFEHGPH